MVIYGKGTKQKDPFSKMISIKLYYFISSIPLLVDRFTPKHAVILTGLILFYMHYVIPGTLRSLNDSSEVLLFDISLFTD